MVVCPFCRWSNPEQTSVCLHCGAVLPSAVPPPYAAPPPPASYPAVPPFYQAPYPPYVRGGAYGAYDYPASRQLSVGQLVWSIINIVLGCMPLGVAALVMTILAQSADWASQEKRRLRAAMVLNIIGSCLLPVLLILFFVIIIGSLAAY